MDDLATHAAMQLTHFNTDQLPATPWKNGGGTTRELACQPAGAGMHDFDWRVSIATIAAAGPFSAFPGVDRVIVLLAGDGVQLRGHGVNHQLDRPLVPFAFAGDEALQCELLGGSSTDFNVMTRRGRCRADVQVLHAAADIAPARAGLLLAVAGEWQCTPAGGATALCTAGHGLWWQGTAPGWELRPLAPGAALIAVRIEPHA